MDPVNDKLKQRREAGFRQGRKKCVFNSNTQKICIFNSDIQSRKVGKNLEKMHVFWMLPGFPQFFHQHAKNMHFFESFADFCGLEAEIENACFLHVCWAVLGEERKRVFVTQLLNIAF